EGDILARLDDTEIRISHQQAKIQLEQARLTLDEEKNNHQRNQELKENELISDMDFQASEARYRQARLEYENKTENFKNLELQLNYTRIRAPVSGFITQRLIEVGDRVTANQHVYTVEDFSPLLIRVFVPAADITKLQAGMTADISSDTLPGRKFTGHIKLINPRIDVQSGTVKVTIEVDDSSLTLKPGMFVEVNIVTRSREDALVIPRTAVLYQRDQVLVFRFREGRAVAAPVTVGVTEDDRVEIVDGLEEGDIIIIQGAEVLKDGVEVSVLK
ncbi:MAG: efflux RND transporter periplasmic adaptor subunit, partial [Candidatus Aminicenantes bacterium]|nr:efflux RND transporter periplasmic adaptor subunit [Candidatus Aminicenantes bacterium]